MAKEAKMCIRDRYRCVISALPDCINDKNEYRRKIREPGAFRLVLFCRDFKEIKRKMNKK